MLKPKPVYPEQDCPAPLSKPKWLRDNHNILLADRKMAKIFPNPPSVSYRQPRSLKQLMVRSRLKALPYRDFSDLEEKPDGC